MNKKAKDLELIYRNKIFAVIRAANIDQARKTAEACIEGGIKLIEITMTIPDALVLLSDLNKKYFDTDILIGAGTVLDSETANSCILSKANFIVCPIINEQAIKLTLRHGKIIIPGAFTLTEIVKAAELGGDIVKFFPANLGGTKLVKGIKKVLPRIPLCPTGGITLENFKDWIETGVETFGVGSFLTKGSEENNFNLIREKAKKFIEIINKID